MNRTRTILMLLALLLTLLPSGQLVNAAEQQCFAQTNQCIEGRFLEYWRANGGLQVFGYPITAAREEFNRDTGKYVLTQWFERNRFELHPQNARPYDVLLGRLGDDMLVAMGISWANEPTASGPQTRCLWFATTKHNVCDQEASVGFKRYWESHGLEFDGQSGISYSESLALFGMPLTEPRVETNSSGDTVLTQWFERARFEYHPSNQAQYRVLLGLLGNEARAPLLSAPRPELSGTLYVYSEEQIYGVSVNHGGVRKLREAPVSEYAALSPNGKQIVVNGGCGNGPGLCLVDLTMNTRRPLNTDSSSQVWSWSPDGTRVAYTSDAGTRRGLYVLRVDGSGETKVASATAEKAVGGAVWSPDSTMLAYTTSKSEYGLYIVKADGTNMKKLVDRVGSASWAPSATIAFQSDRDGNSEIYTIKADGTGLTRRTNTAEDEGGPRWSPDGTKLAYLVANQPSATEPATNMIVVEPASGGARVQVLSSAVMRPHTFTGQLVWSPDSTAIVAASNRACSHAGVCEPDIILGGWADGRGGFELLRADSAEQYLILVDWK